MLVPVGMGNFHKAHALFHHPAGQQALAAKVVGVLAIHPIGFQSGLLFTLQAHHLGQGALHAKGQLKALDDALDLCVGRILFLQVVIE